MHLGKFVHTETGKIIMSILLGFGLASLFRIVCKDKDCLIFYAPPLEKIKDKIYNTCPNVIRFIEEPKNKNKYVYLINFNH